MENKSDKIERDEPNSLDGSSLCPRQNLEGKPSQKYPEFAKFLSDSEIEEYVTFMPFKYKHETVTQYMDRWQRFSDLSDKIDKDYVRDFLQIQLNKKKIEKSKTRKINRHELGAREFTLTYSPKWFDDAEARLKMSTAIQKICKYYKDEIIQLRAVGEVGTNGLSHIHCFYKLTGGNKITDKNFKRAYSWWDTRVKQGPTGHQGGHHANVKSEADFQGYIDKDIATAWYEVNIDNS